ncbi:MAG: Na+/H+ antiporter [Paenibacillaceae bacterium]|nr:Na+/H+ antiporter [Paenibacillaceae bacterium]
MELFIAILVLLALIGVSNVINRTIPFAPVPLIQIALGMAVAIIPTGMHALHLEPELFFLLFIAPLLYNDGKHTPRSELWRLRAPILLLAVGLVFATVFVVGPIIHKLIPSIPLPVAYGLAAILSPTDAVAVGSLAGRIRLPKSLMHLLEGEALMNDASGLVAFKFAIAAAVTGTFSLAHAGISFLIIAIGGLAVGVVVAAVITVIRLWLRRLGLEDETMHMLLHLLTPFALYLTAEELGVSGILAAVAGGVMHAVERDRMYQLQPRPNDVTNNTWSVILYLLNGLVFVILGVQIPDVIHAVWSNPAFNNAQVFGYAAIIFALLLALRFVWTYVFSKGGKMFGSGDRSEPKPSLATLAMTSLSGVRGAVTLAGAFSIPLFLESGDPFPERSLVIFLAAVVILLSLLAASIVLPLIAKSEEKEDGAQLVEMERAGQIKMMRAAIHAIHQAATTDNEAETGAVLADYDRWIRFSEANGRQWRGTRRQRKESIGIRLEAIGLEREWARRALADGRISEERAAMFMQSLDQLEMVLSRRSRLGLVLAKALIGGLTGKGPQRSMPWSQDDYEAMRKMKSQSCSAVIANGEKLGKGKDGEVSEVIEHYVQVRDKLREPTLYRRSEQKLNQEVKRDLHWLAIQAERDEVQALYERGDITREIANELRRSLRGREASVLEQE